MAHNTHDTRSRKRHHNSTPFFVAGFRYVCHRPTSGTRFVWYQIPAPIRTLFYSKPKSGVHVTEMMTYDWSMRSAYVLMCFLDNSCCILIANYDYSSSTSVRRFQSCLLSAQAIFIPGAYGSLGLYEKPAAENGVDICRQCFLHSLSSALETILTRVV